MSDHQPDQEEEIYATLVEVNEEPTELYKILKIGNLVSGGGEAKQVISEGYVFVNGEEETRKRKKIYAGDLISFNGEHLHVAIKGQTEGYEMVEDSASDAFSEFPTEQEKAVVEEKPQAKKRKPISF